MNENGILRATFVALLFSVQMEGAESKFFDANGVELHYIDEGTGTPVLLMHGFSSSLDMWHRNGVFRVLVGSGYRVVAYDSRAHGKSAKPQEPEKYGTEVVEDARRILDYLHSDRAHVVGYSMGSRK